MSETGFYVSDEQLRSIKDGIPFQEAGLWAQGFILGVANELIRLRAENAELRARAMSEEELVELVMAFQMEHSEEFPRQVNAKSFQDYVSRWIASRLQYLKSRTSGPQEGEE